jgi:hypothetical protein
VGCDDENDKNDDSTGKQYHGLHLDNSLREDGADRHCLLAAIRIGSSGSGGGQSLLLLETTGIYSAFNVYSILAPL